MLCECKGDVLKGQDSSIRLYGAAFLLSEENENNF